jgi:hypothetical protein
MLHLTGTGASGVFKTDFGCNKGVGMGPKFLSCNRSPTDFSIIVLYILYIYYIYVINMKGRFPMGHVLKTYRGRQKISGQCDGIRLIYYLTGV